LLYGSEYDTGEIRSHHHDDVHEYLISKTVLEADCVISLPKLKTHKKTGVTLSMKNMVGMNGNKNWLPHHREGTPANGGDQYADNSLRRGIERRVVAGFKRVFPLLGPMRRHVARPLKALGKRAFGDTNGGTVRSGNWYGNDTTWRMVIDLNRILVYADAEGQLHRKPQRRFLSVVDGIIGGEGNGPLDATAKPAGVVVAGINPVAVDMVCTRLMGFDWDTIPLISRAFAAHPFPLVDFGGHEVATLSNDARLNSNDVKSMDKSLCFEPHFGWKGHIELADEGAHPPGPGRQES